ncbi:GNAT family N-acetyltransferase [Actinomyces sp. ZJ308]|uniref:GNAT family N-acetyltransferase n=1 Tax=Actinomyces sp. ZJ308 TaxID=2708342 RepID=UPI00141F5033|nr:GNAT family N-acetyltransferase [Actinomyces sp. ZJ308]
MTTPSPRLRPAEATDLDAVRDLLTDVFLVDPLMSAIAGAAPDPRAALEHLHHVELGATYLNPDHPGAMVDLAVDDAGRLLGATLWDAPADSSNATDTGNPGNPAGPLGPHDVPPAGLDLGLLGDAWELCLLDGAICEAERPAEPHWYLYMIAVAPGARGTGTGAALLRRGLERVDADAAAAHLEATTRRAASFYERHGFVDSAILNSAGRLPTYWAMTRPKRRHH